MISVRVAEPERTNGKRAPGETKSDAGVIFCMPGIWAARAFQPARNMCLLIATSLLIATGALFSLTFLHAGTGFGPPAWRLGLLGLVLGIVITPMTATAVAAVPHHLAGMASAGNNAFRQVGGVLGPAVLGTLLTTKSTDALPGHLRDAGLRGPAAQRITDVANTHGLAALARMNLGKNTGRAHGALSESFASPVGCPGGGIHAVELVQAMSSPNLQARVW